jgi:C-terminal processing protease CtpA/Prc
MGAGGNVVDHYEAPNSHFDVRQTESLILRRDGSYLENNGVEPDVAIAVNESSTSFYEDVHTLALKTLMTPAAK